MFCVCRSWGLTAINDLGARLWGKKARNTVCLFVRSAAPHRHCLSSAKRFALSRSLANRQDRAVHATTELLLRIAISTEDLRCRRSRTVSSVSSVSWGCTTQPMPVLRYITSPVESECGWFSLLFLKAEVYCTKSLLCEEMLSC